MLSEEQLAQLAAPLEESRRQSEAGYELPGGSTTMPAWESVYRPGKALPDIRLWGLELIR